MYTDGLLSNARGLYLYSVLLFTLAQLIASKYRADSVSLSAQVLLLYLHFLQFIVL